MKTTAFFFTFLFASVSFSTTTMKNGRRWTPECVICQEGVSQVENFPCKHICTCIGCHSKLKIKQIRDCALCRANIKKTRTLNSRELYKIRKQCKEELNELAKEESTSTQESANKVDSDRAKAYYDAGLELDKKDYLDGAIEAYRSALMFDPSYASAHFSIGVALEKKGDLDGAIKAYRTAIRIVSSHPDKIVLSTRTHFCLGLALQKKGDFGGAIEAHKAALSMDPHYAGAYYCLGRVLEEKNDLDGAVTAYEKAIINNSKDAMAHNSLGRVLEKKKDLEGAIEAYRSALRIDPHHEIAQFNIGEAQEKMLRSIAKSRRS